MASTTYTRQQTRYLKDGTYLGKGKVTGISRDQMIPGTKYTNTTQAAGLNGAGLAHTPSRPRLASSNRLAGVLADAGAALCLSLIHI